MITNEGKLVIGHNMMLDVLYTTRQFVQDLPEELTEFKQLVKQVLPGGCIDTKLMSSLFPFKVGFVLFINFLLTILNEKII